VLVRSNQKMTTSNIQSTNKPDLTAYFASNVRAMIPAAMGADAEVPECSSVQRCLRSVVT